jgi:hypothetical protein
MYLMRHPVACLLASAFLVGLPVLARATPPASLDIHAGHVDFYYDRYEITADDNVRVRLSDGTIIRGQTFAMDLKLNRYVVAGDVHVDGAGIHQTGAALAGYLDIDKTYFLPESTATPERWTFFGSNWSDPHPGRAQPGDTFYLPDVSGLRPYIIANSVSIIPKTNATFNLPRILTAGVYIPLPRYVVMFSANSHFFENAFAGGRFDVGIPFEGSAHSLTALHLRNDPIDGNYLAFDQHFVWDRDYVVFGIDPLTQAQRQFNLIGFKHWSPKFETRLFLQESAESYGLFREPANAAAFGELDLNAGLPHSGLSLTRDDYWGYLLGYWHPPDDALYYPVPQPYQPTWREHPTTTTLTWTGFENHLFSRSVPLLFRLRSGIGDAHDAYGEGGYDNVQPGPEDAFYHNVGATLYTSPIKLGPYSASASYDRGREWFNVPHWIDSSDLRFSLGRPFDKQHLNAFISYDVQNTGDHWGAQQLAAYPPSANSVCEPGYGCFFGLAAFDGFATSHALTLATVWTPSRNVTASILALHYDNFPAPVPGAYGQIPNQIQADLRIRVAKNILLDISRSYYFGFGGNRWSPAASFGVLP